ncbi:MAG TPA: gliding motility-associated C-terminal domain-containing protein [Flavobacteriales bacterium]|nr:gliding motility-associated C-terminal domain-containing protein [Flavobacteriales bacterium]
MKNSLNDLLRERFQGHEAPVDPGTWAVIEAKLLTAAPASDPVNDLFRERFQNHESAVDPGVWNTISSQLGHPVAGSGWAGTFGWMAAGIAGVLALGALVLNMNSGTPETVALVPVEPDKQEEIVASTPLEAVIAEKATESSAQPAVISANLKPQRPETAVNQEATSAPTTTGGLNAPAEEAVVVEQIIEGLTVQTMLEVLAGEPLPPAQASDNGRPAEPVIERPAEAIEPPIVEEAIKLFMPNTFTPNGDGINDTYRMLPRNGFSSVLVRVYSMKNNQLVFSSTSMEDEWQGLNCDDGMYLVAVEAITLNGRVVADGKVVWLNRGGTN